MVKRAAWMSARLCTSFGEKKGKRPKKKPQVPLSVHLTLSALALDNVHEFIHRLQVTFGTKIFKTEPLVKQPIDGGNNGGKILKKAGSYGSLKNEAERSNSFGPNGGEQYIDDESDPRESENATKDDEMESPSENLLMPSTMSDFNEEKQIDGHHGNHQNKHSQIEYTISRMDEDSTAESEENIPDVSIKSPSSTDLSSFRTNLQENHDPEGTKIFKTEQPIDGGNNGGKILEKAESYGSLKNEAERSNSFGPNGGEQYIDDESDPRESENATKDDEMESPSENLLMPSTMSDFNEEKQIDGHHGNHQNKHSQIEYTISRMDEDSTAESEENIPDGSIKSPSSTDLSSFRTNLQENQDPEGNFYSQT